MDGAENIRSPRSETSSASPAEIQTQEVYAHPAVAASYLDAETARVLGPSIVMNTRQQRLRGGPTRRSVLGLTSATLLIWLLLGPGFQTSNLTGAFSSADSGTYFENSYQPDSAVSRLERQVPLSDKTARRQVSFGALPSPIELASRRVRDGRTCADVRYYSLTTGSHQNDRAPPSSTL
jgi:hypothetical protein